MPELDGAVVATEVMLVLGCRGHDVAITRANGPRLFRLGSLMLAEFGLEPEPEIQSGEMKAE